MHLNGWQSISSPKGLHPREQGDQSLRQTGRSLGPTARNILLEAC